MRKRVAAVVGSARGTDAELRWAAELGAALIQQGMRVATGGLAGVMDAALQGARAAPDYASGDTIAILPSYDCEHVSQSADVVIRTGLNHSRNVVLVASSDVVLAIGGRAGTLSEISLAWALQREVICVGDAPGWATRLAGEPIDDRREGRVHGPLAPLEAAQLARRLADAATAPPSFG